MSITTKYLEIALEKTGLKQHEIAKKIGVSPQQLTNAKNRDVEIKDNALIKLALLTGTPANKVLAEKHLKTAKDTEETKFWQTVENNKDLESSLRCILC